MLSEPVVAAYVGCRVQMLRAVDLDDQPSFDACEIGDVASQRMLAAKAEAGQLAVAQARPEPMFRLGHVTTQLACVTDFRAVAHEPSLVWRKLQRLAPHPPCGHLPPCDGGRKGLPTLAVRLIPRLRAECASLPSPRLRGHAGRRQGWRQL